MYESDGAAAKFRRRARGEKRDPGARRENEVNMKLLGGKQSLLRSMNRELILTVLSKQSMSNSDLAKTIKLSNTGVVTIIDEMVQEGLLLKTDAEITSVGRRPILLNINPEYGMVMVVMFSAFVEVNLYSLNREVVYSYNEAIDGPYSDARLDRLLKKMSDIVREKFSERRLVCICISAPGKVNTHTGEIIYAPFFETYHGQNLKSVFHDEFGVPVFIKNDIRFALLAEKSDGECKDIINDTVYIQLGDGIGGAMFLDGKLYEGKNGLNGEIGLFLVDCLHQSNLLDKGGQRKYFYQVCSLYRIMEAVKDGIREGMPCSIGKLPEEITAQDVAQAYEEGDSLCCEVVDGTARVAANVLKSLFEMLDFDLILVSKDRLPFGEKYLRAISSYVNADNNNVHIEVRFSTFGREGVEIGAKNFAIEQAIRIIAKG